ncbi:rhodanese-like domain-containing protein [uncultured Tyzzerella sp.]|uniref:rhodanese-like domain-containing protein n=1 Tax=uncultured Tyzzerella sp. TaxID=2321398 RepID=UPI002941BD34|nr:rhodanese-like domain-containing protein [uncultured Tyzzerella sp.]
MKSFKMINAVEAKKIMDSKKCKILDVRTEEEFNESHIDNAILLPLDEIDEKIEEIFKDKDETILVYCKSGIRSKYASQIMAQKGYTNVLEFGGIVDWPFEIVL